MADDTGERAILSFLGNAETQGLEAAAVLAVSWASATSSAPHIVLPAV